MKRETIQQAATHLLAEPVGTERTVSVNMNDGLTGAAPGTSSRDTRMKHNALRVEEKTRPDGKKRRVVVLTAKGTVLATGVWS